MIKAVLDQNGKVIGEAYDVPESVKYIDVLAQTTIDGTPVNVRRFKTSVSKKNLEKASYEQPLSLYYFKQQFFWTFHCVKNNKIIYGD